MSSGRESAAAVVVAVPRESLAAVSPRPRMGVLRGAVAVAMTVLVCACGATPEPRVSPTTVLPTAAAPPQTDTPTPSGPASAPILVASPPAPDAPPPPSGADAAALRSWLGAFNRADRRVASAVGDLRRSWSTGSWRERDAGVAAWQGALAGAPRDPVGRSCWESLAASLDASLAEQASLADDVAAVVSDRLAGRSIFTPTIPGQIAATTRLAGFLQSYDESRAGQLAEAAILAFCYPPDPEPAPWLPPLPGAAGQIRAGAAWAFGTELPFLVDNDTSADATVKVALSFLDAKGRRMGGIWATQTVTAPAGRTTFAWTYRLSGDAPPKGWKRVEARVVDVQPGVAASRGDAVGLRTLRTSAGDLAAVSLVNTTGARWCGAARVVAIRAGRITAFGADDLECVAEGSSARVVIDLGRISDGDDLYVDVLPGPAE